MIASVAAIFLVGLTSAFAQYYPVPVRPTYAPVPVAYRPAVVPVPTARYVAAPKYVAPVPVAPLVKSANPEAGAAVVQEYRDVSFDGNFNYGFDSTNGLSVKSKGYVKPPVAPDQGPIQAIEGSYSYVDALGKPQTINYVADENGYRAYGDSIPQPAVPVPGAGAPVPSS